MIITALRNEEIFKTYKIGKSIFENGFRILVDNPLYNKKNQAVIGNDGNTERLFETRELAAEFVFSQIDKYMKIGKVDKYTVQYKN